MKSKSGMHLETLVEWKFPLHLQNPNGRALLTAAYLLNYHGYTHLAEELKSLGHDLICTQPAPVTPNELTK